MRVIDESCVLTEGPWTHRFVSGNGTRLHIAEAGRGPLVLLLHGFPEHWAAWEHQLPALAEAGFRAVAVDLRGYGASDKPPRGYDGFTAAADIVGLIRALGEKTASIVGTGYGGQVGWTTAALHPRTVERLVVMAAAHPARLHASLFTGGREQYAAMAPMLAFQLPRYEHRLTRDDAALVGEYLRRWAGPRLVRRRLVRSRVTRRRIARGDGREQSRDDAVHPPPCRCLCWRLPCAHPHSLRRLPHASAASTA